MVRSWVFVGLIVLQILGFASRQAASVAQEMSGMAAVIEDGVITSRQQGWLTATLEERAGISALLGEDGARALAKKNSYEAICDGLDRTLPQGPD